MLKFWKDEQGQDLIEYALLGALVAVACVAGLQGVATQIGTTLESIVAAITPA